MVGGRVVGIARARGEPTQFTVREVRTHLPGHPLGSQRCCIRAREREDPVRIGDSIWWQGRRAYWTPQPFDGRADVVLERVGYSYTPGGDHGE